MSGADIFVDLVTEYERIESILDAMTAEQWLHASDCAGWSVADVVLHLAQSEESAVRTLSMPLDRREDPGERAMSVDASQEMMVRSERIDPMEVFRRWREARRASVAAMLAADPDRFVRWAHTPLRPRTLATTRLAEHWAHTLDVTGPLGIDYPDTDRLWHVAWLGHRTIPYGFRLRDEPAHDVYADLVGPGGESWTFGSPDAPSTIRGSAGAFCRVGAQRVRPEDSRLSTSGPYGDAALRVLRNYAA